jgi:hypothetical protein
MGEGILYLKPMLGTSFAVKNQKKKNQSEIMAKGEGRRQYTYL